MLNRRITIFILLLFVFSVSAVQLVWALMFSSHSKSLNTAMKRELLENGIEMTDKLADMYFLHNGNNERSFQNQGVYTFVIGSGGVLKTPDTNDSFESIPKELTSLHTQKDLAFWHSEWDLNRRKNYVLDNYKEYLASDGVSLLPVRAHYLLNPEDQTISVFGKVMYSVLGRSRSFEEKTRELTLKYSRRGIFFTFIGFLLVAGLSRTFLRRNIYKPVQEIIEGINELKQANYNKPIVVRGMKEFGMIANELNALANGTKMLIHEVHHRVKNNLQVIASMMSLQKYQLEDPSLESILQTSIDRIHAMSMIHEYLYKSEGMELISAEDYISSIIQTLTYKNCAYRVEAEIKTDQAIEISIDVLIPIGLILNELILNSYKHAFIPGAKNTIHCALYKETGIFHLEYRDEGATNEERKVQEESSMGMEIVDALSRQLGGEPEISYSPSFSYSLRWERSDQ